jgi:uncharacterized protein YjbJ (UPF0337 family)
MTGNLIVARFYQCAGKLREWLGTIAKNDLAVNIGRRDQLVGRIKERCGVSFETADQAADQILSLAQSKRKQAETPSGPPEDNQEKKHERPSLQQEDFQDQLL